MAVVLEAQGVKFEHLWFLNRLVVAVLQLPLLLILLSLLEEYIPWTPGLRSRAFIVPIIKHLGSFIPFL